MASYHALLDIGVSESVNHDRMVAYLLIAEHGHGKGAQKKMRATPATDFEKENSREWREWVWLRRMSSVSQSRPQPPPARPFRQTLTAERGE